MENPAPNVKSRVNIQSINKKYIIIYVSDGDSASNVEKTMEKIGIAFRDAQGEFRSFEDIINELSEKWADLDTESQRAVAKAMAG